LRHNADSTGDSVLESALDRFLESDVAASLWRFDPLERQDPVPFVEEIIPEDAYRHGSHAGFVEVGGV
jgi:hypothetical protein